MQGLASDASVCAWGDLNFSSRELLDRVRRRADVELIPGISSVQVACARTGFTMENLDVHHAARPGTDTKKACVNSPSA